MEHIVHVWQLMLQAARLLILCATTTATACAAQSVDDGDAAASDLVATFDKTGNIDLTKTTHVVLVGNSKDLNNQPLFASIARARRYAQLYPNDQIVLFVTKDAEASTLVDKGATLVTTGAIGTVSVADLARLNGAQLVSALKRFQRIASLDFYGHSSPFGELLEREGANRTLGPEMPGNVAGLKKSFARDANPYVTLNGCNSGVVVAEAFSKMWQVPVSGSLTATDFQVLMADGQWFTDDPNFLPAGLARARVNDKSYAAGLAPVCEDGNCIRMKPQDSIYFGYWSQKDAEGLHDIGFQYAVGYYKFFCNYADSGETCARGMAQSLYSFVSVKPIDPSSSDNDFKDVLADYFCTPSAKDPSWFPTCKTKLFEAAENNTPFSPMRTSNAYTLECDFNGCSTNHKFRCESVVGATNPTDRPDRECVWVSATCAADAKPQACRPKNTVLQMTNQEVQRYLRGHSLLRGH